MAKSTKYKVKFRRRREGRTDYRARLALLKSKKTRLVVRVKSKLIVAQLINYNPKGDEVLVNCSSAELKKLGWNSYLGNASAAYLTGLLCGKKALKKGIKEAVLDIGLHTPVKGSNVYAVLKGVAEAGLNIPHSEKILPVDARIGKGNVKEVKEKILSK